MLSAFIDDIRQAGKASFTSSEAMDALAISKSAFVMAALRLRQKGALVSPYRDLYIPIPPEYRALGCLPADQLLPILMKHIDTPYYACLLTAAAIYGATHQRPQITQVMVSKRIRPIHCGEVVIRFLYKNKKNISITPVQNFPVKTGYLKVSTPEATLMDLLRYTIQAGGIQHVATLLAELIDAIDPKKLLQLAQVSENHSWIQRAGVLLELLEDHENNINTSKAIKFLSQHVKKINPSVIRLAPGDIKGYTTNKKWHVVINTDIEIDI